MFGFAGTATGRPVLGVGVDLRRAMARHVAAYASASAARDLENRRNTIEAVAGIGGRW